MRFDARDGDVPKTREKVCLGCGVFHKASLVTCPAENCVGRSRELVQAVDFEALVEALVWSSVFADIGMDPLQAGDGSCCVEDVLALMKRVRPYQSLQAIGKHNYEWQGYFITHLLFVLSAWAAASLDPRFVLEEFVFLLTNVDVVIKLDDPELVGEFAHSLRIMGLPDTHPTLLKATVYLLEKERARKLEGAWVANTGNTIHKRYHASFVGLIGVMEYETDPSASLPVKWEKYLLDVGSSEDDDERESIEEEDDEDDEDEDTTQEVAAMEE